MNKYDIRNVTAPCNTYSVPGDLSPVVSIASFKRDAESATTCSDIISCKLNSLWIFDGTEVDGNRGPHMVPIEGPFVSMTYDDSTKHLLVSTRPNARVPFTQHLVSSLTKDVGTVTCDNIYNFPGGSGQKYLSRSCLLWDKKNYVAAYQENKRCVNIWNVNTGQATCTVPAHEPVLDMCGVSFNNVNFLLALTERKLEFFKLCN